MSHTNLLKLKVEQEDFGVENGTKEESDVDVSLNLEAESKNG